jgi:hypothetical protein
LLNFREVIQDVRNQKSILKMKNEKINCWKF